MMMRGDMQKLFDQINPVFETCFNRIEALSERVTELEKEVKILKSGETKPKRGPGRPRKTEKAA